MTTPQTNIEQLRQLIKKRNGEPFTSRDFRQLKSVPALLNKLCGQGFIVEHDTPENPAEGCKKVYIHAPECDTSLPGLRYVFPEMFIIRQPKGGRVYRETK